MAIYKIINSLLAVSAASDADYTSERSQNLSGFADYDDAVHRALAAPLIPVIALAAAKGAAGAVGAAGATAGIAHLKEPSNRDQLANIIKPFAFRGAADSLLLKAAELAFPQSFRGGGGAGVPRGANGSAGVPRGANGTRYQCHRWTEEESQKVTGQNAQFQKTVCEKISDRHKFSGGFDSIAPGCGKCWCCKNLVGQKLLQRQQQDRQQQQRGGSAGGFRR